jgi:hypothetical protein
MIYRRRTRPAPGVDRKSAARNVHDWVLSLPWVVERSSGAARARVRVFAVDCEPLRRRQVWLVTGFAPALTDGTDVAVVLPGSAIRSAGAAAWQVHEEASLPAGHVFVTLGAETPRSRQVEVEALLLAAYSYAMS